MCRQFPNGQRRLAAALSPSNPGTGCCLECGYADCDVERQLDWSSHRAGSRVAGVSSARCGRTPELKCTTEAFPEMPIQALGYEVAAHGNGRWNGWQFFPG